MPQREVVSLCCASALRFFRLSFETAVCTGSSSRRKPRLTLAEPHYWSVAVALSSCLVKGSHRLGDSAGFQVIRAAAPDRGGLITVPRRARAWARVTGFSSQPRSGTNATSYLPFWGRGRWQPAATDSACFCGFGIRLICCSSPPVALLGSINAPSSASRGRDGECRPRAGSTV